MQPTCNMKPVNSTSIAELDNTVLIIVPESVLTSYVVYVKIKQAINESAKDKDVTISTTKKLYSVMSPEGKIKAGCIKQNFVYTFVRIAMEDGSQVWQLMNVPSVSKENTKPIKEIKVEEEIVTPIVEEPAKEVSKSTEVLPAVAKKSGLVSSILNIANRKG